MTRAARADTSATGTQRSPDLPRVVRIGLVVLFLLLSGVGLWYSQTQDVDALTPTPGVWSRWVFWPCLVLLALILTQVPRTWPKRLRQVGAVLAFPIFMSTALVADAAVGVLAMEGRPAVVNSDTTLRRSMHRVNVAADGAAFNAISPAASFAGGQYRNSTTRTKNYRPGSAYAESRPYEVGEKVLVRVDPDQTFSARVIPASGQSGYLWWFPRSSTTVLAALVVLLLGWAWILAVCAAVVSRGPFTTRRD